MLPLPASAFLSLTSFYVALHSPTFICPKLLWLGSLPCWQRSQPRCEPQGTQLYT